MQMGQSVFTVSPVQRDSQMQAGSSGPAASSTGGSPWTSPGSSVTTAGAIFCGPSAASALTGISDNTSTSDKKLDNIRFFISRSSCYDFPDRELELTGPILFPFFQPHFCGPALE